MKVFVCQNGSLLADYWGECQIGTRTRFLHAFEEQTLVFPDDAEDDGDG